MSKQSDMQKGFVDPARLDAAAKPKRRRRQRNRPTPAAELRGWETEAEKRAHSRPYPPGIILEPSGNDKERWTAPHSDNELWHLQLADAFGTRSMGVIGTFLGQLEALCRKSHWDEEAKQWRLDEHQFNAVLALVSNLKPRNEMEAAFAAQMVAVHLLTMKVSAFAIRHEYDTRTAATVCKLARTFTLQMEALQSMRGKKRTARQSIKVRKELHQHIHYHRGEGQSDGQPHGRKAATIDQCEALPSEDEGRRIVPLPSRKG